MDAGYKIDNLLLMECNFSRIANVTFNNTAVENLVDIEVNCTIQDSKVFVQETLKFESKNKEVIEVSATITMLGVFEIVGDVPLTPEEFGNVNGAAMLFPYIREQLSNIALKAGLGHIILPPANFVKMNKDKKEINQ